MLGCKLLKNHKIRTVLKQIHLRITERLQKASILRFLVKSSFEIRKKCEKFSSKSPKIQNIFFCSVGKAIWISEMKFPGSYFIAAYLSLYRAKKGSFIHNHPVWCAIFRIPGYPRGQIKNPRKSPSPRICSALDRTELRLLNSSTYCDPGSQEIFELISRESRD